MNLYIAPEDVRRAERMAAQRNETEKKSEYGPWTKFDVLAVAVGRGLAEMDRNYAALHPSGVPVARAGGGQ